MLAAHRRVFRLLYHHAQSETLLYSLQAVFNNKKIDVMLLDNNYFLDLIPNASFSACSPTLRQLSSTSNLPSLEPSIQDWSGIYRKSCWHLSRNDVGTSIKSWNVSTKYLIVGVGINRPVPGGSA